MRKLILGQAKNQAKFSSVISAAFLHAQQVIDKDFATSKLDLLFHFHEFDVGEQSIYFIRYPLFIKMVMSEEYFPTERQIFATILQAVAIYCTNQKLTTKNELVRTIINTGTGMLYARRQVADWQALTIKPAVYKKAFKKLQKIYAGEMVYDEAFWFAGTGELPMDFLPAWSALALAKIAEKKKKSFLQLSEADLSAYLKGDRPS